MQGIGAWKLGGLSAIVLLFSCQEDKTRAPVAPACEPGELCEINPVGVEGTSKGGSAGVGGATSVSQRSGSVVDLVDDSFDRALPYGDAALVEAEGRLKPLVSARWNGVDPFEIQDLRQVSSNLWLSVRPETGPFHLRTLHPMSGEQREALELGLIRADTIDFIYASLSLPAERVPGYGQVVLSLTEGEPPRGLAGVSVATTAASFVAYQFGGNWTLEADRTDASGLVILGNIVGSVFPGTEVSVTLTIGATPKGFVRVQVASDAVTLLEVPILP